MKLVGPDWTGPTPHARKDVRYAVGEVTLAPDWDPAPRCGGGIHYAETPEDWMPELSEGGHLIYGEPVGERVRVVDSSGAKSKAQGWKTLGEITAPLHVQEEPDASVRALVASRATTFTTRC